MRNFTLVFVFGLFALMGLVLLAEEPQGGAQGAPAAGARGDQAPPGTPGPPGRGGPGGQGGFGGGGTPRLLLLDEPLSSLDAELRAAMRTELARIQRSLELTMVYVTHDREDAAVLADRVIEMRAGRIVEVTGNRRTEERA